MTETAKAAIANGRSKATPLPPVEPEKAAEAAAESVAEAADTAILYTRTMLELQREMVERMAELQRASLSFWGNRLRKDLEITRKLADCRDLNAALELQAAFIETAREDYMHEAERFVETSQSLARNCLDHLAANAANGRNGR